MMFLWCQIPPPLVAVFDFGWWEMSKNLQEMKDMIELKKKRR